MTSSAEMFLVAYWAGSKGGGPSGFFWALIWLLGIEREDLDILKWIFVKFSNLLLEFWCYGAFINPYNFYYMQFVLNKIGFNFATNSAKADAYSPFASVSPSSYSISMISKIKEADFSLIIGGSQEERQSTSSLLPTLSTHMLLWDLLIVSKSLKHVLNNKQLFKERPHLSSSQSMIFNIQPSSIDGTY